MDHQIIAALVLAERRADDQAADRHPYDQQRLYALRARDRAHAARVRADRRRRLRAALARGIRRVAEAVEPPRPACISSALDPY